MKLSVLTAVAVLLAFIAPCLDGSAVEPQRKEVVLCRTVILRGTEIPDFSESEKRLVCGDPKSQAWRKISLPQARYFMRNFLQQRGYHRSAFQVQGDVTTVEVGPPTILEQIVVDGAPATLEMEHKRDVLKKTLTPALLDTLETWVKQRLEAQGYPCPRVTTEADPETGMVQVHVKAGAPRNTVSVIERPLPGLMEGIFRRYDAFQLGELYNGDLLTVTENRIASENIVESIHLRGSCSPEGAVIRQDAVLGPPRLLRVGFGMDTEGLFQVQTSWQNSRLGRKASWFRMLLQASSKLQIADATFNWYHLPYPSRRSIRPNLRVQHDNELFFETLQLRGQLAYATSLDTSTLGISLLGGPTYEQIRTYRGPGLGNSHFLSLATEFRVRNHAFEYFSASPRAGFSASVSAQFNDGSILSTTTAQRIGINGEALWNLLGFDPPLWVFGIRGGLFTTITGERPGPQSLLPPTYFHYLGGSADLRGFGRQELPTTGNGGLTSAFFDFEVRLSHTLPLDIEPVAFVDVGAIGTEPVDFDSPVYWSPGFGLRWASPIGIFRTTLAHGFPNTTPQGAPLGHWQFYLSYGEEF